MKKMRDSGVEWIGEVPEGWEMKYLSQSVSQVKNRNDGLKEKNLLSLSYGKIKRKDIDSIGGLLPASFEGYNIIAPNDIVLRLTDLQNDQHSLRVGLSHENGIVTSAYTTIRPCDRINAVYLFYSLFAFDIAKGFYGMGTGVRQGLNYDEVKQIKLLSPPLPEQRRIADYLDEKCAAIDGAVCELKRGIEDCKAWKKAIIFEAVTGKANVLAAKNAKVAKRQMRDSGIPWIGEIPEGWEIARLKSLFSYGKGLAITKADLTPKGVPVISYGQIHAKANSGTHLQDALLRHVSVDYLQTDGDCLLKKNDFVFADTSEDLEGLGNCAFVDRDDAIFAGYHTIVFRPKCDIPSKYLAYLFKTDCWRSQFRAKAYGIKVYSLSQRLLNDCSVILPPEREAGRIANYLDEKCAAIDALVAEKEKLIADLEAYKKSLIFELVTGKREVA